MALRNITNLGSGGIKVDTLQYIVGELQGLKISGPLTGANANTVIAVTDGDGIDINDTILKVLVNAAGTFSDATSSTSIVDTRASGTLTLSGVVATDTCSINGTTLTFTASQSNPSNSLAVGQVSVGATDTVSATNLAAAINNQIHGCIATSSGAVVTVIYATEGTSGNSVALVGDAHITASGATLSGGSATKGVKISTSTTGDQVFVVWYDSPVVS